MKLAIMQPYFFPYLGYFDLINYVDLWIVYDTVQFIKQGWINRNRIFHPNSGWQYISVPLNKASFHDSYRTPIKDIQITADSSWRSRIIRQLEHYKNSAPRFQDTIPFIENCLDKDTKYISELNVNILEACCSLLGIDFDYMYFSEMDIELNPDFTAQGKILAICEQLNVSEYANLPGGVDLYDSKRFVDKGIQLTFRYLPNFLYDCGEYEYIPNLSMIDVLMWNEPTTIKLFLDEYMRTNGRNC